MLEASTGRRPQLTSGGRFLEGRQKEDGTIKLWTFFFFHVEYGEPNFKEKISNSF